MKTELKKQRSYYMTDSDYKLLMSKASSLGYTGRGAIELFLSKVAKCYRLIILEEAKSELKL